MNEWVAIFLIVLFSIYSGLFFYELGKLRGFSEGFEEADKMSAEHLENMKEIYIERGKLIRSYESTKNKLH